MARLAIGFGIGGWLQLELDMELELEPEAELDSESAARRRWNRILTLGVSPPAHPETISRGVGEPGTAGSMQLRGRLQKNKDRK